MADGKGCCERGSETARQGQREGVVRRGLEIAASLVLWALIGVLLGWRG